MLFNMYITSRLHGVIRRNKMTKRVIHQEYLEAWLRGGNVQRSYNGDDWTVVDGVRMSLDTFDHEGCEFRITPKTVEVTEDSVVVSLTDFYAEYDKITTVNFRESFLEDLIAKYLPRESSK